MRRIGFLVFVLVFACFTFVFAAQKNPWTKFKEGSWVMHKVQGGSQQKMTLVSKTADEVVLKVEAFMNQELVSSSEMRLPLNSIRTSNKPPAVAKYNETVEVKGGKFNCKVYEMDSSIGKSRTWVSENMPGGTVKSEINGAMALEVIDYEVK